MIKNEIKNSKEHPVVTKLNSWKETDILTDEEISLACSPKLIKECTQRLIEKYVVRLTDEQFSACAEIDPMRAIQYDMSRVSQSIIDKMVNDKNFGCVASVIVNRLNSEQINQICEKFPVVAIRYFSGLLNARQLEYCAYKIPQDTLLNAYNLLNDFLFDYCVRRHSKDALSYDMKIRNRLSKEQFDFCVSCNPIDALQHAPARLSKEQLFEIAKTLPGKVLEYAGKYLTDELKQHCLGGLNKDFRGGSSTIGHVLSKGAKHMSEDQLMSFVKHNAYYLIKYAGKYLTPNIIEALLQGAEAASRARWESYGLLRYCSLNLDQMKRCLKLCHTQALSTRSLKRAHVAVSLEMICKAFGIIEEDQKNKKDKEEGE